MDNDEKTLILKEFIDLGNKLNSPSGLRKWIRIFSGKLSLKVTEVLQRGGCNAKLAEKYNNRKVLLNIGSGDVENEDLINSDIFPSLGGIVRWLKGGISYKNKVFINVLYSDKNLFRVADGIIFSHVLEHLSPHLAIPALLNIKSFLKPGGILRISVPDLALYDQSVTPKNQQFKTAIIAKNSLIYGWGHRFMYDADLLIILLEHCGFENVHQVLFGEGPLAHTDFERRKGETVYLVAYA